MIALRLGLMATASLVTGAALAHPGHVAESGGHSHWLTYGAAAVAVVIIAGALVVLRRRAR